jgi:hypothetical protein
MHGKISHMEKCMAKNKPHNTSKSMAEGEQGKDEVRQKKCMAK